MNLWIDTTKDELLKTIAVVDCLTINDAEARQFGNEPNLIKAAKSILELGPKILLIKRGEYGAALFTRDNYFATPAFPLENVFDPTGAGDSFAGEFIGYWLRLERSTIKRCAPQSFMVRLSASFNVEEFSCEQDCADHSPND